MKVTMKRTSIGTSLAEVYEALGDIPIVLSYDEDKLFGDMIEIEALGSDERKEKLKGILGKRNETCRL